MCRRWFIFAMLFRIFFGLSRKRLGVGLGFLGRSVVLLLRVLCVLLLSLRRLLGFLV